MRVSVVNLAHYRLLVVGGGSSGLGASHKFAKVLPEKSVAVIEPNQDHYYQPGFTLVGGGLMSFEKTRRNQKDLVHPKSVWIQQHVKTFNPEKNSIQLNDGETVSYDYLVIATGCQIRFDLVKGLQEALETPGVCSIYSPKYAQKTYEEIKKFKGGNCIFTFPSGPIKCPGAPQKIAYVTDERLRQQGVRDKSQIHYFTTLPRVFGVEKYANALQKVVEKKGIDLHTRHNLIEVDHKTKKVTFQVLNAEGAPTGETKEFEYSLLHVGPPCSPIAPLKDCKQLTDAGGWVDVDPKTLQSKHFPNVFGIGDCVNTPNPKTAASISSQLKTLEANLKSVMDGGKPTAEFDGYGSCPLVVGLNKAILAEFTPKGPLETLPIDQAKPMIISYWMKRYLMPALYWHGLIKGLWNGPATIRKILHFGMKQ